MSYLVGSLNKQIIILENKNVCGQIVLTCCNDITKLFNKLPLKTIGNEILVSREEMENEILRYTLKNKDRINVDEIINNSETRYTRVKNLYQLYLLIMLEG